MSVTPQLFDPTLTSPFSQPVYFGKPGPYEHGTDKYWIVNNFDTGTGLQHVTAYKLSAGVFTKFVAGFTNTNQNGNVSVFWPGTGAVIYIGWQGRETSATVGLLHATTFDMSTDTFGTDNSTGVTTHITSVYLLVSGDGNLNLIYDTSFGVTGRQCQFMTFSSGSWSSPATFSAGTGLTNIEGAVVNGAGNINIVWIDATNINHTLLSSGVAASATVIETIPAGLQTSFPFSFNYDPATDSVIWAFTDGTFGTRNIKTLIGSPAAVPIWSTVLVANDPSNDLSWNQVDLALKAGQYSILTWSSGVFPLDGIMSQWLSTDLATWTGPTTYYDEEAQPPTPPPDAIELFPIYSRYLLDGKLAVAVGMFYPVDSEDFCGVLVYLTPSPPPSQTLQLNKIVVGGSASPSDFTLTAMGNDSPATILSGPGPQVGPTAVPAITYDLSENQPSRIWNNLVGTWNQQIGPWENYIPSVWVCTGGGSMPNDHTIIVPMGATIVCTITNTAPITPPFNPTPCSGVIPPAPSTDTQFELRRVYAAMKPAPRIPVRGGS